MTAEDKIANKPLVNKKGRGEESLQEIPQKNNVQQTLSGH